MKDRTPKYPGRVKLEPVAGQTNIFDMTRADEPDDTGTPFNTRTMLQNSTGRFLKLPYANPLVDDAFRHMPDRIEPIGTVKTSAAQNLGDAWLPCDGSQVTFVEYPELYQMLRNISSDVTWESSVYSSEQDAFNRCTKPIYFKGKWYIFGSKLDYVASGAYDNTAYLTVVRSESLSGSWETVYEKASATDYNKTGDDRTAPTIAAAASEDMIVCRWNGKTSSAVNWDYDITICSTDGQNWTYVEKENTGTINDERISDVVTDGVNWATAWSSSVWHSASPEGGVWSESVGGLGEARLSRYADTWIASWCNNSTNSITVKSAQSLGGTWTTILTGDALSLPNGAMRVSNVVLFKDYYYMVVAFPGELHLVCFTSAADATSTKLKSISYGTQSRYKPYPKPNIAVGENILAILYEESYGVSKILTSSVPSEGFSEVDVSSVGLLQEITVYENTVIATGAGTLAYHDYSNDVRTLPTISLSADTTTFIKAKNELDVFEAGGD